MSGDNKHLVYASKDDRHFATSDEDQHVDDYRLVRDRTRKTIKTLEMYGYSEFIAYS